MKTYRVQALLLVALAFILGFSEFIIIGLVAPLAHQFVVPASQIGLLVTVFALVYALSTPILNLLIGARSLYRVLLVFLGIFILGNLGTALAPNFAILTGTRILTAVVSGSIISLAITIGNSLAPVEKRVRLVAWIFSGFSIASVFGVPLGTALGLVAGWRSVFGLITLLAILIALALAKALPQGLFQEPAKSLRHQLLILQDRRIQLGLLLPMLNLAGIYTFYTYLSPLITQSLQLSPHLLTPILFIFGLMSLASNLLSGRLAEMGGLRKIPFVFAGQTILLISLPFLLPKVGLCLGAIMLLALSMYLNNSPIQMHFMTLAEQKYPQALVFASSFNSICANLGIALGSAAGSWTFKSWGLAQVGPVGAIFAGGAFLVSLGLNYLLAER
ncbi:MFS transporter [Lactobacillus sp. DCY120]|uniref:MFS transporter n=1 Tax=Bombilactobacillus apium TaxID=2675299 RepID=A0A850RCS7_9LACO|nr:MFS transporter [Bombilactobacillus apium]NVY96568.1 MFS transporter [Bombilactobacillus apium]